MDYKDKELSIEEKAKAYDEAIAVINKSEKDKYGCIIGIKPSDIFPELKESEDERIRKQLIAVVELYYGKTDEQEKRDCLSWLEKKSEQKSVEDNKGNNGGISPNSEWSKEDDGILTTIINEVHACKREAESYEHKNYDRQINWLKSLKDRCVPQKQWKPIKAKLVIMHDLQCKKRDWVLTKKDCDMIANALCETYGLKDPVLRRFHNYLKDLGKL